MSYGAEHLLPNPIAHGSESANISIDPYPALPMDLTSTKNSTEKYHGLSNIVLTIIVMNIGTMLLPFVISLWEKLKHKLLRQHYEPPTHEITSEPNERHNQADDDLQNFKPKSITQKCWDWPQKRWDSKDRQINCIEAVGMFFRTVIMNTGGGGVFKPTLAESIGIALSFFSGPFVFENSPERNATRKVIAGLLWTGVVRLMFLASQKIKDDTPTNIADLLAGSVAFIIMAIIKPYMDSKDGQKTTPSQQSAAECTFTEWFTNTLVAAISLILSKFIVFEENETSSTEKCWELACLFALTVFISNIASIRMYKVKEPWSKICVSLSSASENLACAILFLMLMTHGKDVASTFYTLFIEQQAGLNLIKILPKSFRGGLMLICLTYTKDINNLCIRILQWFRTAPPKIIEKSLHQSFVSNDSESALTSGDTSNNSLFASMSHPQDPTKIIPIFPSPISVIP